jgi:hypothetical protein
MKNGFKLAIVYCTNSNDELHIIKIDDKIVRSISINDLDESIQETEDEDLFNEKLWSKTIEVCKELNCDTVFSFEDDQIVYQK